MDVVPIELLQLEITLREGVIRVVLTFLCCGWRGGTVCFRVYLVGRLCPFLGDVFVVLDCNPLDIGGCPDGDVVPGCLCRPHEGSACALLD